MALTGFSALRLKTPESVWAWRVLPGDGRGESVSRVTGVVENPFLTAAGPGPVSMAVSWGLS